MSFERVGSEGIFVELTPVGPNQFPELRAPVADVIVANYFCAAEGEQATDGFADNGRSQMPDMHLLGRVGRGIIHDPGLAFARACRATLEMAFGIVGLQPGEERGGLEAKVDEAGTGERDFEIRL